MADPAGTVMGGSVDPETLYTKQNCIGTMDMQHLFTVKLTYP